jgi:predicted DNA-binding WGR domain protein
MQIITEWAGHFYDPNINSDKIWASTYTDTGDYIAVWGRRGSHKYQSQTKRFGSLALARAEFKKMVNQKQRKGYQLVPFEDTRFGSIPSFKHSLGGSSSQDGPGKITRRGLLERIHNLVRRVKEHFEPDTMLVEFNQLHSVASLVLEYNERLGTDADKEIEPHVLEAGLDILSECIRKALLA